MGFTKLTPAARLMLAGLLGIAAVLAAFVLARQEPWLGLRLAPDGDMVRIVAAEGPSAAVGTGRLLRIGPVRVVAEDLVEEPDYLPTYAATDRFFARQEALRRALRAPRVELEVIRDDGRREVVPVAPRARQAGDLPLEFWLQLAFGLGGLWVGGWLWSLRSADLPAQVFALSGLSMLAFSASAAVYSTRELALGSTTFRLLSGVNHAGAMGFGAAMITLFLIYPRRLAGPRLLGIMNIGFALWLAADLARLPPGVAWGASGGVATEMALIVAAVAAQAVASRRDPVARAALRWLGLSVVIGAGGFILSSVVPTIVGGAPLIEQGYAFGFFFLIYASMALGLRRHRVFELDEWAFQIAFYGLGVACLVALDAALVFALRLSAASSLTVALLAVGFAYLPLRDRLWRRFVARRRLSDEDLFAVVVEAALAPHSSERLERWRLLVERLFEPLEIAPATEQADTAAIRDGGLEMVLPATAAAPALAIRYPWRGRGLFGQAHLRLAQRALTLMERIEGSRQAYERGRTEERRRIAQDLHDDVGALLLSGLHKSELGAARGVIRHALSDIGAIVDELTGEVRPLAEVLGDLRFETGQRLEEAGIEMDWPMVDLPGGLALDYAVCKNIRSALREIVSNTIRHSGARRLAVRVAIEGARVRIVCEDDGRGLPAPVEGSGHGLKGLQTRLSAIGGELSFPSRPVGACVTMAFPAAS